MVGVDFECPYSAIATVRNTGKEGGRTRFIDVFDSIVVRFALGLTELAMGALKDCVGRLGDRVVERF